MVEKTVNKLAVVLQKFEQSKYPSAVLLNMFRTIQLNRYSCGLQCAYSILNYHGKIKSINEIYYDRKKLKIDGIDTEPLIKLLTNYGITISVNEKASIKGIQQAIDNGIPLLISVDDGEHWVVIYGYCSSHIFILDSALTSSLRCAWPISEFLERWDENWIAAAHTNVNTSQV